MIEELTHLLSDPAHWAFEAITDLAFGLLTAIPASRWLRRHDKKKHGA